MRGLASLLPSIVQVCMVRRNITLQGAKEICTLGERSNNVQAMGRPISLKLACNDDYS